jgi:antitoxin HicB
VAHKQTSHLDSIVLEGGIEMRSYQYPAVFTPAEEGGFVVTFPDVPEAITGRINTGEEIPRPSAVQRGQYLIPVPPQTAFKAALYDEIHAQGLSKVELAAKLGIDEKEVRRLLDPYHPSKLPRIAEILERVGKHIVVQVEDDKELVMHV